MMAMLLKYIHVNKKDLYLTKIGDHNLILHFSVYPPSEDTFFMIDTISNFLNCSDHKKVAEPCTGSGLISIKLALLGAEVLSSDINFLACYVTKENLKRNTLYYNANVVCGNLLDFIKEECLSQIICNPPYLPESRKDLDSFLWWNGGKSGVDLIEKLIVSAKRVLKRGGGLLFLASSLSNLNKVKELLTSHGLLLKQTVTKDLDGEKIVIFYAIKRT